MSLVDGLRISRMWKFLVALVMLLVIVGLLEFIFVTTNTSPTNRSTIAKEKYAQEVRRRIKEVERLVITTRDEFARDKILIQTVRSKDRKQITHEIFVRDSLLRYELGNNKGVYYRSDFLAFAVYDSLSGIVGWNTGTSYIKDVETRFSPPFDISKRVKGIFFEETPTRQYLTAFHKLFDEQEKYVGYIVIKFFLCDEELTVNSLHEQAHGDVFSDIEKKENIVIRLASKLHRNINNERSVSNLSISLDEGGPLSIIHANVSIPTSETSAVIQWNSLSALRDLLVILLLSTILFSLYSVHVKNTKEKSSLSTLVKQTGAILLYTSLFRYLFYLLQAGRSLVPESLTLQTDFAYQSMPMLSDAFELLLSTYILTASFISLFILYTSKSVISITLEKSTTVVTGLVIVCIISVLFVLSLFLIWFVEVVTTNCSFDLSDVLEPLAPTRYFLPLLSLFLITLSVIILCVGVCSLLGSILEALNRPLRTLRFILCCVILSTVLLLVLFAGDLFDVGAYLLLIAGILSYISTIRIRFTPQGYQLTRSPVIALTLASVVCFILAPAIKRTNENKQKQNLEQSVLAKAGFQFSVASLQLTESVGSSRSYFAGDTIGNAIQIPLLLLREHERLQGEIPGVKIILSADAGQDSIANEVDTGNSTKYGDQRFVATIPFRVKRDMGDTSMSLKPYILRATLTNDLLAIGLEDNNTFILLYTNDKIERSSQTYLNIPTSLAREIKSVAGKGTWIRSKIDDHDVLLFVKSIYSISTDVSEKILVGGLIEYSFGDVLVFGLRYSTLALALTALLILVTLALTNNISITRFTLRFRERIFLIIFSIALVPLIFVSNITRTILQSRESEDQRRELVTEADKVANVVRPLLADKNDIKRVPVLLQDLSRTLDHRIDVFDGNGLLLASSAPELYEAFVLPRLLPVNVVHAALTTEQTSNYREYSNERERTSTSYQSVYDQSFTTLLGIVAITRVDVLALSENEIAATTSLIYGTFSLVALLLLIIGSYVSYRVASPLQEMITATEKVAKGEFGTQVTFDRKDEIGDLASAFNKMTKELDSSRHKVAQSEREGAWKEMARQVAHEIKNPLTPMKLSVQHVQHAHEVKDTNFSAVFSRVMKTLSEQIDVLTRIASEFSRFGEMPRRRYAFINLKKVVESALALFDSERAHIRFVTDISEKASLIYADEEEFRRTLVNLLRNAVQSMDGWGVIVISSSESNGIIHLSIKDTGSGMSEETLRKAFDPNFSTKTSGMGLGLAIVKRTITDMSGTIRVESEIGKGTTFHIDLPAREV